MSITVQQTPAIRSAHPHPTKPPIWVEMTESEIERICQECHNQTKIGYTDGGSFFTPTLRSINHLEVGYSPIISNPLTILLEWLYVKYKVVRDRWTRMLKRLFPRREKIYGTALDSQLVGTVTFAKKGDIHTPVHNMRVEFWARTWLFQWRLLSKGYTNNEGKFTLPYDLRAARAWTNRKVQFEIYQTTHIYYDHNEPISQYARFKVIGIPKNDLIGLSYNLGITQLFYWEYRTETKLPRVVIKDHDKDAPEQYCQARTDAAIEQTIPIELTKRKHLDQIRRAPQSISIYDIQADYPINLTQKIEQKLPGYTRSDEWFGKRMMNGMNAAFFQPDEHNPYHYWVKYFGACNYDINDAFAFPTAEIKFKLSATGLPAPIAIRLTGPLNAYDRNPWQIHEFIPDDGEKWEQAKRVARVNGGLCTELDEHLTATHLNTEQFAIAAYRNLRRSPIACLLLPHLKEVSLIDHTADKLLINGYIPQSSALTAKGCEQRALDMLGCQDWKYWQPMKPLSEAHTYAKAEQLFWDVLGEYIDIFFEQNRKGIEAHWFEIYRFSEDLLEHAVPVFGSQNTHEPLTPQERKLWNDRIAYYSEQFQSRLNEPRCIVNGELKVLSPITKSQHYDTRRAGDRVSLEADIRNLKQACRYIIMMATFMHTWVNEHQYDDIGEVLYNCLGLRFGEKKSGVMAPESDMGIAPDLTHSTQMMWFSNLLSRTEYGFITANEEGDINPIFKNLLLAKQHEFAKLGVDVTSIESRTNI